MSISLIRRGLKHLFICLRDIFLWPRKYFLQDAHSCLLPFKKLDFGLWFPQSLSYLHIWDINPLPVTYVARLLLYIWYESVGWF